MEGGANVTRRFCFGSLEDGTVFPYVRCGAGRLQSLQARTRVRSSGSEVTRGDLIVLRFLWACLTSDPEDAELVDAAAAISSVLIPPRADKMGPRGN